MVGTTLAGTLGVTTAEVAAEVAGVDGAAEDTDSVMLVEGTAGALVGADTDSV